MKLIAYRGNKNLYLDEGQDLNDIEATGILEEGATKKPVKVHCLLKMGYWQSVNDQKVSHTIAAAVIRKGDYASTTTT